jgi:hypothetical protein
MHGGSAERGRWPTNRENRPRRLGFMRENIFVSGFCASVSKRRMNQVTGRPPSGQEAKRRRRFSDIVAPAAPFAVEFNSRKHVCFSLLRKNVKAKDELGNRETISRGGKRKRRRRFTHIVAAAAPSVLGLNSRKHLCSSCLHKNVNVMEERERGEESASAGGFLTDRPCGYSSPSPASSRRIASGMSAKPGWASSMSGGADAGS